MRRHARSKKRKVYEEGEEGAAEIGSRVFPFRTPPPAPASMPSSVGTRRSTRVFVPKASSSAAVASVAKQQSGDEESTRVLRSGKRFALSKAKADAREWLRVLGSDEPDVRWWKKEGENGWKDDHAREEPVEGNRMFGIVYSRKRRRILSDSLKDRKYGIVFARKQRRKEPTVAPLVQEASEEASKTLGNRDRELRISENSRNFAEKVGISGGDLWTRLNGGSLLLALLVEAPCSDSSYRFARLIGSIMNWMRRARVICSLWDLVAFLLSGSIASVFSLNGIHFLPLRHHDYSILDRNSISGCGFCKIYGASEFVPLLSLHFSALPSYFKSLHATMFLGSLYLPRSLRGSFSVVLQSEEHDHQICSEMIDYSGSEVQATPLTNRNEMVSIVRSRESVVQNSVIMNGSRIRKHQRKRSSVRNSKSRNPSFVYSHFHSFHSDHISPRVSSAPEACSQNDFLLEPIRVKPLESCVSDFFIGREDSDVGSSPGSNSKQMRYAKKKTPVEKIKELKLALAEVRQNIDSARCSVNILVTGADRCWREDGAEVMLEMSGPSEWYLAVKRDGVTKYLHKPQDMRPCVVNRFTHAYMWSGEDAWKLEFFDKWDWYVFKELHVECRDRNIQDVFVRIIPVPGVREVSDYEDNTTASFVRPDMFIHMMFDEVGRALTGETAYYDMDSADEEWLKNLNSSSSDAHGGDSCISEQNFENIIFALERDAYNHPDEISAKDRALDLCQGLGKREMVAAVYDYWLKKRKQKRAALVKVFQGPPLRRAQLIHKPFLRKKRSFKRQRSQTGRGKQEFFMGGKRQEYLQRSQDAEKKVREADASRSEEIAIRLRNRAQLLMANADLALYRATMALRIAEELRASSSTEESNDLLSSVLLD